MPQPEKERKIDIKRKKLQFRSWHRGTREIDMLLGRFADAHLSLFSAEQLDLYDQLLHNSDPDIYNWISQNESVPEKENNDVVQKLIQFYDSKVNV